ncbi:Thioesterase/thiol ester dehydrase-isomerase [Dentipellis sp. KUC8613]|nr:Thioesterase/thiol ester dehydrase-isomerase [Dentipellis sp. KUC8613]
MFARLAKRQLSAPASFRRFSISPTSCQVLPKLSSQKEAGAREEIEDVRELDTLLKAVEKRVDRSNIRTVPMRGSSSWAQALLDASREDDPVPHVLQEPLPPRTMQDSYTEIFLPFASSPELLEQYTNASGGIRTGKLLEHLDSLAGSISYKHMLGPGVETLGKIKERGYYIVTASVDRLDMLRPLMPVRDLRLSGHVIHVGKSSMEVVVKMEALERDNTKKTLMLGRFAMVCRDSFTQRAHPVNPLETSTPEERALKSIGEFHRRRRQSLAALSLSRVPPTSSEAESLHSFVLKHGKEDEVNPERVWMGDTALERTMLMFPQERNVHQKIFGGYLMRLAYELGFTNCRLFTRRPIRFLSLDKISFAKPVPIGSILRLTSHILHTTSSAEYPFIVHTRVEANVVDVETGAEVMTNDFRFTWCGHGGGPLNRKVVPKTYNEAMLWLEGRRELEMGAGIQGLTTTL